MARKITIHKSLTLFPAETGKLDEHKIIRSGSYEVEVVPNPIKKAGATWFKLAGEPWGNAKACWESMAVPLTHPNRRPVAKRQTLLVVLTAVCAGLTLLTFDFKAPRVKMKAPVDLSSLKMQLDGAVNQLQNLTNHYPQMAGEAQKRYMSAREDAVYGMEV